MSSSFDDALTLMRLALAVLAAGAYFGSTAGRHDASMARSAAVAVGVVTGAAVLSWAMPRLAAAGDLTGVVLAQVAESVSYLGVAVLLTPTLPAAAWALLVIPVVIGSLRFGSRGVVATWTGVNGSYIAANAVAGWLPSLSNTFHQSGVSLAIAGALAVLSRWLREGWLDQAAATAEVEERLGRIQIIEFANREMSRMDTRSVVDSVCANVIALGFRAATMTYSGRHVRVEGDGSVVASEIPEPPPAESVEITRWEAKSGDVTYSASVWDRGSRTVISGWSSDEISEPLAQALVDLAAGAGAAMQAARHLELAQYRASHDALTGALNRAELMRRLAQLEARRELFSIAFLDLDEFKSINDKHGHQVGDHLLIAIARRVGQVIPEEAFVARYGGDEFVVVAPGADPPMAKRLAESMLDAMALPFAVGTTTIDASFSVGLATGTADTDAETVLGRSDEAVYAAKGAGRNTFHVWAETANSTLPETLTRSSS